MSGGDLGGDAVSASKTWPLGATLLAQPGWRRSAASTYLSAVQAVGAAQGGYLPTSDLRLRRIDQLRSGQPPVADAATPASGATRFPTTPGRIDEAGSSAAANWRVGDCPELARACDLGFAAWRPSVATAWLFAE